MPAEQILLHVVVSQPFSENTYIAQVPGSSQCIVVDPGLDPGSILEVVKEIGAQPAVILNTHGHADHIAGNGAMKRAFPNCPLVIGHGDAYKLRDPQANLSAGYGLELISPPQDEVVREGDQRSWAGITLEVLETPGHSAGHVVFVCKQCTPWIVLGGDVLFRGSIGRTDFPDGSFEQLKSSIHNKLFTLPDDTIVYTGHGEPTTIGEEKRYNPFVGL